MDLLALIVIVVEEKRIDIWLLHCYYIYINLSGENLLAPTFNFLNPDKTHN